MRQLERLVFFLLLCSPCLFHVSHGRRPTSTPQKAKDSASAPPIRAVNLEGWLVTEGWILPSLFDGIPNKDFLDGTQLQFKSVTQNMFLSAEQGGGTIIVANRTQASGWETFKLWRINESTFNLKVFNNQFVTVAGDSVTVVVTVTSPRPGEAFQIVRNADKTRVRIRAPSGKFLQKHWSTYIVESDFKFISTSGLNAVRIPVGWWIASDPNPRAPFIGGSLQALDNAFKWARKYNLGVIVDLHAAPGSQNPFEHSASRDGSQDWGKTDANIAQTVQVIDFLASRYANFPSLLAVELLNEPLAPGVSLPALTKYYEDGYNAVRKHTASAYVIMSNRLSASNTELLDFASGFSAAVVDGLTADQNIEFVRTNRSSELSTVTRQNGPLTFVGEWVAEWNVGGATKEDYQRFAQVQIDVYGRATFGWSYWTLKNVRDHWSMQWMINNGYISLNTTGNE
ncbi:hypothetical protein ABZP36_011640 [Zizania latifolia]